jgi:hypothetical protein
MSRAAVDRGWLWILVGGSAVLFAVRALLSIPRSGPLVVADEIGYLMNGRVLAGGVSGQLSTAPFYHGGYSLLLAPLFALGASPTVTYHLVLLVNAALAMSVAPLVHLLLTRCFSIEPRLAVWPALAAAAYPSLTIYTQIAVAENLLAPLVVVWLLAAGCLIGADTVRRRLGWTSMTSVAAVWLWATHGRMIVVLILSLGVFALLALRPSGRVPALLGVALLGAGLIGVHRLNVFLVSRNWNGHAAGEFDRRLSTLGSLHGVGAFLRNFEGQAWYLMVSTLGLLLLAAASFGSLRRRSLRPEPRVVVTALMLLTLLGLLVESALSFPDVERADMFVYGRYTEVVLPPLLGLVLVRLGTHRLRVGATLGILAVATLVAALLRAGISPSRGTNRWNVASLPVPISDLAPKILVAAGVVGVVATMVATVLLRRAPLLVAPVLVLAFVPVTALVEHAPVLSTESAWYGSRWTDPGPMLRGVPTVAFDTDSSGSLFVDQWFARRTHFVLFSGDEQKPPSRYVITSPDWVARNRRFQPVRLWSDELRHQRLVRLTRGD